MIKIENTDVYGWEAAVRGMRNPMNSWDKSDSGVQEIYGIGYEFVIGENDLKLMQNLAKAGSDHAKYLRMINVTMDVTAPLYWWKEADTYGVGVVKNSCSTMHKIHAKEFTLDDFSYEHLMGYIEIYKNNIVCEPPIETLARVIQTLNVFRKVYLETKDKEIWWQMIQLLPSSYNQKRTVQLNYAVLWNMYCARKNHKLDEWREFCKWCESLPYFKEIFGID